MNLQPARSQRPEGVRWGSIAYWKATFMQFTEIKKFGGKKTCWKIFSLDFFLNFEKLKNVCLKKIKNFDPTEKYFSNKFLH